MAVFSLPETLLESVLLPKAELPFPVVLGKSAFFPKAELAMPLPVSDIRAPAPPAVLPEKSLPVGLGGPAQPGADVNKSAKPTATIISFDNFKRISFRPRYPMQWFHKLFSSSTRGVKPIL